MAAASFYKGNIEGKVEGKIGAGHDWIGESHHDGIGGHFSFGSSE